MIQTVLPPHLTAEICTRAVNSRDARFDGLFFVGITSTHIYCRPICPARVSYPDRRRFFATAASAEGAGFRPCLRCRPELAPGAGPVEAVSRLAQVAAERISAGALNGSTVGTLATELGVSERHLRRALEREVGVSPLELAQTHRLLLAKRLLADTDLPVTRIAYASGFQSLRRFNALFRERYRLTPSAVRKGRKAVETVQTVRLTLSYRAPFAWDAMLADLERVALPSVESVGEGRYVRAVVLGKKRGMVNVSNDAGASHLNVDFTAALLPELMPLLGKLRRLFDLDAEPRVIDRHLGQGGLGREVARRPGLRVMGAFDGFDLVLRTLARGKILSKVVEEFGGESGEEAVPYFAPTPSAIAEAGAERLVALGMAKKNAGALVAVAKVVASGECSLEPTNDIDGVLDRLRAIDSVTPALLTAVATHALHWPDAYDGSDPRAESWRPWRAYGARHLV